MLPILTELRLALDMQKALERHVEEGNFSKAFQVLSEYLQLLDSLSELSAVQEMSRGVEVWLGTVLQKLDSLLLQVCQEFKEDKYITVIDAMIGDVSGLAEKLQSFFMQEVLLDEEQEEEDPRDDRASEEAEPTVRESRGNLKRKGIESDEESPPRKPAAHRRMAVVYDSDED